MSAAPCILYAEDEPDDVFFMTTALRRAGLSAQLQFVEDGEQALAYLSGLPPYESRAAHPWPAVVLLDLNLPMRSGFEVLQWIRQNHADLPVIVFSSSGRPEDRARAQECGATAYWIKPSSGLDFTRAVSELGQWLARSPSDVER